jgi:integrase
MGKSYDENAGSWVVQNQKKMPGLPDPERRCKRILGDKEKKRPEAEAEDLRQKAELAAMFRRLSDEIAQEQRRAEAAKVLGIDGATIAKSNASARPPTLREFLTGRWADYTLVAQNATTRRTTKSHVAYILYHLDGDLRLDEFHEGDVAKLREGLFREGPKSFSFKKNGEPRKPRVETFASLAINRILGTFAAVMNLAERERVIERAPRVALLPSDDSEPIVPPTDEELRALLDGAADFVQIAPFMKEAIELAAGTGMRAGEQFTRTWRNVDFKMGETGAIRIEKQPKVKLVDGQPWRPKHKKSRIVPLTPEARELLLALRERVPHGPDDPVIPSRGGSPYVRLEAAPDKAGMGYFAELVDAVLPDSTIRWHDLRHYFAVRALLRGVPIAVVSSWLGHTDVNLTVKQYGRWAAEAREQWQWARKMSEPIDAIPQRPALDVLEGGGGRQD